MRLDIFPKKLKDLIILSRLSTANVASWEAFLFDFRDTHSEVLTFLAEGRPQMEKFISYNFGCRTNEDSMPFAITTNKKFYIYIWYLILKHN